ncbi:MAG: hypothetical protein H7Y37_20605 [Anaerolineae bacterium]|nr:hypothetical protein [Gloeobacterales cyanobacterium ES-bin-313]
MAAIGELVSPSVSFGMDPRRWKRIEELFHLAAELPVVERTAFVVAACDEDESLAQEVISLLAFHHEEDQETLLMEMRSLVQERRMRMQAERDAETENSD